MDEHGEDVVWVHPSEVNKKYKKVKTVKEKGDDAGEWGDSVVVYLKSDLGSKEYISLVLSKLEDREDVVVKAKGQSINKLLMVTEKVRRSLEDIHTTLSTESTELQEYYLLKDKHFSPLQDLYPSIACHVISTTLCVRFSHEPLNTSHPGYQPPVSALQKMKRKKRK
eukprot:TRINITY_DN35434_c0_g1_i1.p1 TRINITY_DN35434_c0_g1~~TRINITY_DN35434_c0_g1_i1.p1  ORF type:complete len:167 (+),score=42.32 TRINITY_DN35434_c0_g1_i1:57-557(+)